MGVGEGANTCRAPCAACAACSLGTMRPGACCQKAPRPSSAPDAGLSAAWAGSGPLSSTLGRGLTSSSLSQGARGSIVATSCALSRAASGASAGACSRAWLPATQRSAQRWHASSCRCEQGAGSRDGDISASMQQDLDACATALRSSEHCTAVQSQGGPHCLRSSALPGVSVRWRAAGQATCAARSSPALDALIRAGLRTADHVDAPVKALRRPEGLPAECEGPGNPAASR